MPHLQVFHQCLFSGARLGGTDAHGKPSLAIPLMIFIISQEQSSRGSKWTFVAGLTATVQWSKSPEC